MDKELLLHEAMARVQSKAGSNWMGSGNSKLSVALEHYLGGSADKDQAALIEEAFIDANLTLSDLRASAFKDAARHIKMVGNLTRRQYQAIRHLQRRIDSIDCK